jgi:GMP synthase (glutamine-hydrolysing)
MVLIIKHIDIEGPGSIEDFLLDTARTFSILDLSKGDRLPASLENIDAVVSLGGPMNVYEEQRYPFLKEEDAFIKRLLCAQIPFLGICLGSQLLAKAAGARVVKSPQKEIGWFRVRLTEAGMQDVLFAQLKQDFSVFQWHEDMSEIPKEGAWLSLSQGCPHQAFRVGRNAYGLQFHVEVNAAIVDSWINAYARNDQDELFRNIRKEFPEQEKSYALTAGQVYANFFNIVCANKI